MRRLVFLTIACVGSMAEAVDFNADVRPIFVKNCLACHGGVRQMGGLSLIDREVALAETDSGMPSIEPGDAQASYLIDRVTDPDDEFRMPPAEHGPRLSEADVRVLREWIDAGASWDQPWAFESPEPAGDLRPGEMVDRAIAQRLAGQELTALGPASDEAWLRRVSFDLVGLPPTAKHRRLAAAGLSDDQRRAVVNELLASPHFGERWAAMWLDLSRYADTNGYERDFHRDAWPYRDWVIRAFNAAMPIDEFLTKQIAGDLLPGATIDDRVATAFHRNTPTNVEGGTDDEEFRVAAVVDRVDTTGQALLGLTMGCARCHDHPYDPVSQEDYYRFFGFFNSTQDADLHEEWPVVRTPIDRADLPEAERLTRRVSETRRALHTRAAPIADATEWVGVAFDAAESTGNTRLELRAVDDSLEPPAGVPRAGGVEIAAVGTVTDRSLFTAEAPAPEGAVTALRIDALPEDPEAAVALPEMGFVLSRLRATVVRVDGAEEEVFFSYGFCDEPEPFFSADSTLEDSSEGWGVYTRMRRPRWATFVLHEPLTLGAGDRLKFLFKHDKNTDGQGPLVIRRLRASFSADTRWTGMVRDAEHVGLRTRLAEDRKALAAIETIAVPVMAERPDGFGRQTHLLDRGNWLSPTERLAPGAPQQLTPAEAPVDDRAAMAEWLTSPENPLTARVFVNRVWAQLFGRGLVETVDDFGSTGVEPTHPELLDHLAARFAGAGAWDFRALLTELVLTDAYRRDARASPELLAADPQNRWYARGPRTRLSAEMVRDQALVLSGYFNERLFGPPVMPYQPAGVWMTVHSAASWSTAQDDSRFRRAIYIYWKRTAGYPSLMAFDMPTREQCAAKRDRTNTPLQALVTLNDPAYVELSEGFADRMLGRMLGRGADTLAGRIAWGYEEATGRAPAAPAIAELVRLHADARAAAGDAEDADRFAMAIVAGALMNLDATLTK